jgi:DNA-binding response OmpR family regulator
MGQFFWASLGDIPEDLDLRRQGWDLADHGSAADHCVTIVHVARLDITRWAQLLDHTRCEERRMMLVGGANTTEGRTALLADGFGDAVADHTPLEELEARARRLADLSGWVPRRRSLATLELDLMARQARYLDKPLNLHPLEFALLWRLADTPDEPVSKQALVQDIWRLGHMPQTNSIAVQMSRLRGKLVQAGLEGLVETVSGGYRIRRSVLEPACPPAWSRDRTAWGSGRVGAGC